MHHIRLHMLPKLFVFALLQFQSNYMLFDFIILFFEKVSTVLPDLTTLILS